MKIFSFRKTASMLKDQTGAALMMALATFTILTVIASEVMYETSVEFAVSTQSVNQVKAHYAAKAGVEISLLRLQIYRKIMAMIPKEMLTQIPMIDMIWKMPFSWPPMLPKEVSSIDKDQINAAVKGSKMDSSYMATIESESSKIDLSLLASSNEELVKITLAQLNQIFVSKMDEDEEFARKYSGQSFTKLVNNIADWVDENKESLNGGEESTYYQNFGARDFYPPNQPFKTFEELHMVAEMTDDIYDLLLNRVTIYGAKAINVKYAPKEVLQAAYGLTEEQSARLLEERSKEDTQILKDPATFLQFIESLGVRKEVLYDSNAPADPNGAGKPKVPITVEPEFNFRVKSMGQAGRVQKDVTAIVYDYDAVLAQLKKLTPKEEKKDEKKEEDPNKPKTPEDPNKPQTAQPNDAKKVPNERPTIVYWNEK